MALTLASLQPVLDQFRGDGPMVSCYVDLSAAPGNSARWPGPLKAKVTGIKSMLADDPRAWQQFERSFQAIGHALEAPEARHARGVALFSALQREFFQSYFLDVPVANELVVHSAPYLVPLLQVLCRQCEYLVVHTNTHCGRLYAATPGHVRLIEEIEEEVPRRQHSAGERWGKQQATIARHREDRILHYQKELIERIAKVWEVHAFHGIVLLGEHETLEHVRKRLPARLASLVVYEGPQAWTDKPLTVADTVQRVQAEVAEVEETRWRESLEEHLRQGYAIATGPRAVIEALRNGRVGPGGRGYLVLGPDPHEVVARCTGCRSLWAELSATCPSCQAPCLEASLWEEILLQALRHDIAVHCLPTDGTLALHGGLAAVLPRRGPVPRVPVETAQATGGM